MKRLSFMALLALIVAMTSCGKNETDEGSRYYVRYTGMTSTLHNVETTYTFATDTGSDTYNTTGASSDCSVTVGPVKKGFQASIVCACMEAESYYIKNQRVTIEVSKDGDPFALKASGTNQASYIIDY